MTGVIMNGYVAFYNGKRTEVYAEDLYSAKQKAIKELRAPKKKEHMVSVVLAEKGGTHFSLTGS